MAVKNDLIPALNMIMALFETVADALELDITGPLNDMIALRDQLTQELQQLEQIAGQAEQAGQSVENLIKVLNK